jgi:hypothetical protein
MQVFALPSGAAVSSAGPAFESTGPANSYLKAAQRDTRFGEFPMSMISDTATAAGFSGPAFAATLSLNTAIEILAQLRNLLALLKSRWIHPGTDWISVIKINTAGQTMSQVVYVDMVIEPGTPIVLLCILHDLYIFLFWCPWSACSA